jgi:hypothetical protein
MMESEQDALLSSPWNTYSLEFLNDPKHKNRDRLLCTFHPSGRWWLGQVEFDLVKERNGTFPITVCTSDDHPFSWFSLNSNIPAIFLSGLTDM